jgi:hypothetical protein
VLPCEGMSAMQRLRTRFLGALMTASRTIAANLNLPVALRRPMIFAVRTAEMKLLR